MFPTMIPPLLPQPKALAYPLPVLPVLPSAAVAAAARVDLPPIAQHQQHQPKTKRRKRECPQCHKLFSNLTTHRAIHDTFTKPYSCSTCQRPFKRINDLQRHEKAHLSKLGHWQYVCPLYAHQLPCHVSGKFTRGDTYKNHLRAIHFKYPPNTSKSQRALSPGHCKDCGMAFGNVSLWLADHIDTRACPAIAKRV